MTSTPNGVSIWRTLAPSQPTDLTSAETPSDLPTMSESNKPQLYTIELQTVMGQDQHMDRIFTSYLDEYSIHHKISEEQMQAERWPIVSYTGGPISLKNMLKEKFGYSLDEIREQFPELGQALDA